MSEEKEEAGTVLTGCLLLIVLLPIGIAIKGFVLKTLWLWFLVPLGCRPISLAHAWGLVILAALFTESSRSSFSGKSKKMAEIVGLTIACNVIGPFLALLTGWIAALFM